MGVPRAITVLRDRFGVAPRGKLRELVNPTKIDGGHGRAWYVGKHRLGESELSMIDIIEKEALDAGLDLPAAAAMVANAWSESNLIRGRVQPGQPVHLTGVGLFQLTADPAKEPQKGTFEQRKDPVFNTRYMLSNHELKAGWGAAFRKAMAEGAGVDSLAAIFARDLERCAECAAAFFNGRRKYESHRDKELVGTSGRAALARLMFPTLPHTGDINPQVEAKPYHGGAWSASKPPDINYTPAPVPQNHTVPTRAPSPISSVDTVLVAPNPISEPAPEDPASLTTQQLLGIGVASAVVATFAGVIMVRSRHVERREYLSR